MPTPPNPINFLPEQREKFVCLNEDIIGEEFEGAVYIREYAATGRPFIVVAPIEP